MFSYQRDVGGTRGLAHVQGDHWQFAIGREAGSRGTNCYSVSTAAPTSRWSFIYGELNKLSERIDRLEKQKARWLQRRRKGRGHVLCYRCQQLGNIARYCRVQAPTPATKGQPSIPPSSASVGSAISDAKRGRGVDGTKPEEGCEEGPGQHQQWTLRANCSVKSRVARLSRTLKTLL